MQYKYFINYVQSIDIFSRLRNEKILIQLSFYHHKVSRNECDKRKIHFIGKKKPRAALHKHNTTYISLAPLQPREKCIINKKHKYRHTGYFDSNRAPIWHYLAHTRKRYATWQKSPVPYTYRYRKSTAAARTSWLVVQRFFTVNAAGTTDAPHKYIYMYTRTSLSRVTDRPWIFSPRERIEKHDDNDDEYEIPQLSHCYITPTSKCNIDLAAVALLLRRGVCTLLLLHMSRCSSRL